MRTFYLYGLFFLACSRLSAEDSKYKSIGDTIYKSIIGSNSIGNTVVQGRNLVVNVNYISLITNTIQGGGNGPDCSKLNYADTIGIIDCMGLSLGNSRETLTRRKPSKKNEKLKEEITISQIKLNDLKAHKSELRFERDTDELGNVNFKIYRDSIWENENYYSFIDSFSEGLALVKYRNKFGYIDNEGRLVIETEYDKGYGFVNGKALVKKYLKTFLIDKKGNFVKDLSEYNEVYPWYYKFYRTRQIIGEVDDHGQENQNDDNRYIYGFLDANGNKVINDTFSSLSDFDSNFLAIASVTDSKGHKYVCLLDTNLKTITTEKYDQIDPATEGLYPAVLVTDDLSYTMGFIDTKGNQKISFRYNEVFNFRNGLAIVKEGNRTGLIARNGGYDVIPFLFKEVKFVDKPSFKIIASIGDMKFEFDKNGRCLNNPSLLRSIVKIDSIGYIWNAEKIYNSYVIRISPDYSKSLTLSVFNDAKMIVKDNGKTLIDISDFTLYSFMNNKALMVTKPAHRSSKTFLLDTNFNKTRLPFDIDETHLKCLPKGYFWVKKDELSGIIKGDGTLLIEPKYKGRIYFDSSTVFFCDENKFWGALDLSGREIIPFKYKNIFYYYGNYGLKVRKGFKKRFVKIAGRDLSMANWCASASLVHFRKRKSSF